MRLDRFGFRPPLWAWLLGFVLATGLWLVWANVARLVPPAAADFGEVCVVAPPTPYDPASGLSLYEPRPVPPEARCPVCGMYPARAPEWAAQLVFDNGDTQFFDSPVSLLTFMQDVGRYARGREASQIAASYVRDTGSGDWIDASKAVYVSGSSALGPMRAGNLPAFQSAASAQRFASARGGIVLEAGQIKPTLLKTLNGKRDHAHAESSP